MESLSDIVASMRRGTKLPGYWRSCDLNKILAYHADRIEAAWKREKAAWHKPGNAAAKKHRRTKADDPSKILHDYWRDHYEV